MADLDDDAIHKSLLEEVAPLRDAKDKLAEALSELNDPDTIGAALFNALWDQIPRLKRPKSSVIFMASLMAKSAGLPKPFGEDAYASLGEPNG